MSHECPVCGLDCHCGGDIDDCCFNWPEYVDGCTHCPDEDYTDEDCYTDPEYLNEYPVD